MSLKIGFIGLGNMGNPMSTNLIKAGYELGVYDLDKNQVLKLEALGAKSMNSAGDAAYFGDIVFTSLPNPKIVTDVYLSTGGIVDSAKPETILVDMSTVTPQTEKNIYKAANERNIHMLDAPVSGGVKGATNGKLSIMVGGDKEIFDKIHEVLQILGEKIYYLGEIGSGQALKLINQLIFGTNVVALCEAFTLGVKAGMSPDVLYEVLSESAANSYAMQTRYKNFIAKGNFNPGFSIDLMAKDMGLAIQMAKENGSAAVIGNMAEEIYKISQYIGNGSLDISGVINYYEKIADVEVRS
jgi:2-hydroxymethylglutarate dehydrogenase